MAFATTRFDSRTYGLAVTDTRTGEVLPVEGRMAFDRQPAVMPGGESLLMRASGRDRRRSFACGSMAAPGHACRTDPNAP